MDRLRGSNGVSDPAFLENSVFKNPKLGASRMFRRETGMAEENAQICGIVRPIAQMGEYSAQHWIDVAAILDEAIAAAGFQPRLVSDADGIGVIQARIVQNLYADPIVVCDVSGKNPNVMFELGMRLAFDKPVVVVKDDLTAYSFDTSPIEHLTYPSTLHYGSILDFKEKLATKLKGTHEMAGKVQAKSFLQHFGPIKVAELGKEIVPGYELLKDEIIALKQMIRSSIDISPERSPSAYRFRDRPSRPQSIHFSLEGVAATKVPALATDIQNLAPLDEVMIIQISGEPILALRMERSGSISEDLIAEIDKLVRSYRSKTTGRAK